VLFIYATKDFEKLKNMNRLRDGDIAKIVDAYNKFADISKYAKLVSVDEVRENDYNLNVARYVDIFDEEEQIDISQVWAELRNLETARQETERNLSSFLRELGYEQ
jgi:type I restriction enzyme M protein